VARAREQAGPTQYVIASDASALMIYVHVSQTMGVHGSVTWTEHELLDNRSERVMARFSGDGKDNSFPTMLASLRSLLDAAEKVYNLERERQSRSN